MFYYLASKFLKIYCSLLFKVKCTGLENIPKTGAVIFCANHSSNYDPVVLGAFSSRPISFMAKKELYQNAFMKRLMFALNTIPVDREKADMESFRASVKALKEGGALGIFSQGTRVKDGEESATQNVKAGVALFALKGNADVIPVGISGSFKPFTEVYINFGKPMTLDEYRGKKANSSTLEKIAAEIMQNVELLRERS